MSETYYGSYRADTPHESFSVTKSFISTLIGTALDKGYIDRIDPTEATESHGEIIRLVKQYVLPAVQGSP